MQSSKSFPPRDFFKNLLGKPYAAISYTAHELLSEGTNRHVIRISDEAFDVAKYAAAGHCTLSLSDNIFSEHQHEWEPAAFSCSRKRYYWDDARNPDDVYQANKALDELHATMKVGWYNVKWQTPQNIPVVLDVVFLGVPREEICERQLFYVIADSYEIGSAFVTSVEQFVTGMSQRIWVFENGSWSASADMYRDVKPVTFNNLVLTADKGIAIKEDLENFLQSRSLYEEYGLPWKRGYLFAGPPGNGKTHLVKALINHAKSIDTNITPLYVKSFRERYSKCDDAGISAVFKRARARPAILVLEDIDTLVTPTNRSFFLNELDGFHSNHGVIVLATTNYPEKLDAALRDRPSRFDRMYQFDLPDAAERRQYLEFWNTNAKQDKMKLSEADIEALAADEMTADFSFAYLKELLVSSSMQLLQQTAGGKARANRVEPQANGVESHANGVESHANGVESHANGVESHANGVESHANGVESHANGTVSALGQYALKQVDVLKKSIKAVRDMEAKEAEKADKAKSSGGE